LKQHAKTAKSAILSEDFLSSSARDATLCPMEPLWGGLMLAMTGQKFGLRP
jgi:hypothetical protein